MGERTVKLKKIVAVLSGKGGCGKTTCSLGTALALKSLGYRPAILDVDLENPSLGIVCGLSRSDLRFVGELIVPPRWNDIPVISLSMLPMADFWDTPTMVNEERKHEVIVDLFNGVDWGDSDILLLDCPPGVGEEVRGVLKLEPDGILLITTPQQSSGVAVSRAIVMCQEYGISVLGVIENDVHHSWTLGVAEDLSKRYHVPALGYIPWDQKILEAMEKHASFPIDAFLPLARAIERTLPEEAHVHTSARDGAAELLQPGSGASQPPGHGDNGSQEVPRGGPAKRRSPRRKASA